MTEVILMGLLGILMILVVIFALGSTKPGKQENIKFNPSPELTDMYLKELDRMILYDVIYSTDVEFGNTFRDTRSVTPNIENDELFNVLEETMVHIVESMSDTMRTYLYETFGKSWIEDYIRTQSISIGLNYADYSIRSLTKIMFTSENKEKK